MIFWSNAKKKKWFLSKKDKFGGENHFFPKTILIFLVYNTPLTNHGKSRTKKKKKQFSCRKRKTTEKEKVPPHTRTHLAHFTFSCHNTFSFPNPDPKPNHELNPY
jgi:hypothetical protein